jgi:hypothetical protein
VNFADAVRDVQADFAQGAAAPGSEASSHEDEYSEDPRRADEAARVDDLVQRFALAELRGIPIGRSHGGVPPIGKYLSKQISHGGEGIREEIRSAIVKTLARAYASLVRRAREEGGAPAVKGFTTARV